MTEEEIHRREHEQLLEFLYLVPVGLAQIDARGDVALMNSTGAQLLVPLAERSGLDNLFDVLKEELEEGRELYKSRVSQEIYTTANFFDRAVVDIVVRSKAHIKSKIW